jgi:putative ABC transport system substrate-binding protein
VLWNPAYSDFKADWRELRRVAQLLSVTLLPVGFRQAGDLPDAFAEIRRQRVDALIMFSDLLSYNYPRRVAELAAQSSVPGVFAFREIADAGGLMSFGPNLKQMWRRAASYVVRVAQGSKPADMAIEQPTRFELVINMKTARELGLAIPQTLLLRADEVIQ